MKAILYPLIAVLLIVFGYSAYSLSKSPFLSSNNRISTATWDFYFHWKKTYNKTYTSEQDDQIIYIFKDNLDYVSNFNKNHPESGSLTLNQFADINRTEFKAKVLKSITKPSVVNKKYLVSTLPDKIDWRDKQVVSDVKDQGFSSAEIFAPIDSLESLYAIKSGNLIALSTAQIQDCLNPSGLTSPEAIFNYTHIQGIESETAYPEIAGRCKYNEREIVFQNTGYVNVPENDEDQLAAAVSLEPVVVLVDATNFQFYTQGIFSECGTELNHELLVVGFNSKENYWIAKNSWGVNWGENGYIRIKKNSGKGMGTCGIAISASYPTWNQ